MLPSQGALPCEMVCEGGNSAVSVTLGSHLIIKFWGNSTQHSETMYYCLDGLLVI